MVAGSDALPFLYGQRGHATLHLGVGDAKIGHRALLHDTRDFA